MPVLHLPQIGQHAGGQCLDPAGGVGAGRHRGGAHPVSSADLLRQCPQDALLSQVGGPGHLGERGVDRGPVTQPLHQRGQRVLGQLGEVRLPHGEPLAQQVRLLPAVQAIGDRGAQQQGGYAQAPGHERPPRDRRLGHGPYARDAGHYGDAKRYEQCPTVNRYVSC